MSSRYRKTNTIINDFDEYQEIIGRRNLTKIKHYKKNVLKYPTNTEIAEMNVISLIWNRGDSMMKYAHKYYDGRPEMWWVIAHFNSKPTDHHFAIGQAIHIPLPLEHVIRSYGL
jgi:hypothetical protein